MFREPPYFDFFPQGRATAPPLTFPKISNLLSNVNDHFMDHPGVIFIFIRGGRLGGKTKFAPQFAEMCGFFCFFSRFRGC